MDQNQLEPDRKMNGTRSRIWFALGIAPVLVVLISAGIYFWMKSQKQSDRSETQSGQPVSIPEKIMSNQFGWLGGGPEDTGDGIVEKDGKWVRPHPGAFVWDMLQKAKDSAIDFTLADQEVNNYQKNDLGILATVWPFADWDQKNLVSAADCKVPDTDEFLLKNDKKGRGSYLPEYRCNPSDWTAYQKFVEAVVERYDGDGVDDMPGLEIPIKYWEVMNEPDLQYGNNLPASESNRLNFYMQGPAEYATLLVETSKAIRLADPEAKILIAGAAGADERMLGFYRVVLKNSETLTAFDIGNVHCISNDERTSDFNVSAYKTMLLLEFNISKPIWVTEAEAMYSTVAEENFLSTKKSVAGAIAAGAQRIFFTRDDFGDTRTDMSKINSTSSYPSSEKYREIINSYSPQ